MGKPPQEIVRSGDHVIPVQTLTQACQPTGSPGHRQKRTDQQEASMSPSLRKEAARIHTPGCHHPDKRAHFSVSSSVGWGSSQYSPAGRIKGVPTSNALGAESAPQEAQADAVTVTRDCIPFFHEGFLSLARRLRLLLGASAQGRIRSCYVDDHKTHHVLGTRLSSCCFFYLVFLIQLSWVFSAAHGLSQAVVSEGYCLLQCVVFSLPRLLLPQNTGL